MTKDGLMRELICRQLLLASSRGRPLKSVVDILSDELGKPGDYLIAKVREAVARGESAFQIARTIAPLGMDRGYIHLQEQLAENAASLSYERYRERMSPLWDVLALMRARLVTSVGYACAVLSVALLILGIISAKVAGSFESAFEAFGSELPEFTKLVLNVGGGLSPWMALLLILLAALFFVLVLLKHQRYSDFSIAEKLFFLWPVKTLTTAYTVLAYQSLLKASDASIGSNGCEQKAVKAMAEAGMLKSPTSEFSALLTEEVLAMYRIGEALDAGEIELEQGLVHISRRIITSSNYTVRLFTLVLQIIILIFVGAMLAGLYLPIFALGGTI
ncbi:hypothetical protein QSV34_02805 [Porticoccus sp. W117]|uniref:hypothetical protein n=1 Tax=Porticoccus sp. W117 TaxID=3054777 RepID=UPI002595D2CF|nr:hypothetical protein [Porticoccus sp. W117]MDM3870281.1 hypothetical protein [Porticoccus sp. W117]